MGTRSRYQRLFIPLTFLSLLVITLAPVLQAADYYADITITVDASGFTSIRGLTNYPNLTIENSEQYTSKQQSHWLLNITKQEIFSEFVFEIILPTGSSISYIKSSGSLRIEENSGRLIVTGLGENESLSIVIQYQTEKQTSSLLQDNLVYLLLFSAIVIVALLIVMVFLNEKKTSIIHPIEDVKEPLGNMKGLNDRQKQIMQILHERNTPLTQTDIQRELQIPKASVSRNLLSLERKGLIEKEQIGMSNLIRLKKP